MQVLFQACDPRLAPDVVLLPAAAGAVSAAGPAVARAILTVRLTSRAHAHACMHAL